MTEANGDVKQEWEQEEMWTLQQTQRLKSLCGACIVFCSDVSDVATCPVSLLK